MPRGGRKPDRKAAAVAAGWEAVRAHPLFAPLGRHATVARTDEVPANEWAFITAGGQIFASAARLASPEEWSWVFAHLLLHLGLGHGTLQHTGAQTLDAAHAAVCDVEVHAFLGSLRFGRNPLGSPQTWPQQKGAELAELWRRTGVPEEWRDLGVAGASYDVVATAKPHRFFNGATWEDLFAAGLTAAVTAAVDVAGGARDSMTGESAVLRPWELARRWFIASYPLLGALMSSLTVVADAELARGWDISIAAVSASAGELYINPHAQLSGEEWRFVLAHEALHAALAHSDRVGGRDAYLWNLACDYVINGWLVEMGVGAMPDDALYDPQFAGESAESVYDTIAVQARRYRKLRTLRGAGGDLFGEGERPPPVGGGVDLDELLRRSLATGLDLHASLGRGTLPAGLVQEIRALSHPPLTWDVQLARWFDEHFPAVERRRSYARPSRRQAAVPDIPLPGYVRPEEPVTRRTFGVVLDTSGSMNAELLGKALGAIASYAAAREVPAARVVFCDAAAYDAGYLAVEEIAGRVQVRGRGGTVLQPGIDLLERAADFPADGPILVITDGECDVLRVRRDHAYLVPAGASLPFRARGPVFRVS